MISGLPTGAIYQHVSYRLSFRTLIFMCVSVWKQRMLHKRGSNIIWNCAEGITSQRVLIHEHYLLMVGWVLAKVCLLVGPTEDKSMVILFHSSWRYSVNFISAEVNWSSFLLLTIEGTHWLMQICGTYRSLSWIGKGTGVNMNTPTFKKKFFFTAFHSVSIQSSFWKNNHLFGCTRSWLWQAESSIFIVACGMFSYFMWTLNCSM